MKMPPSGFSAEQYEIFARSIGFMMRAPGFAHPATSKYLRMALGFVLALCIIPRFHVGPRALDASFLLSLFAECLIGAAIGTSCSVLYDGAYAGGRALDDYLGIRSAVPTALVASGAEFGRFWSSAFYVGLFYSGAFERFIELFAGTFQNLPPGMLPTRGSVLHYACAVPTQIVLAGVVIIGPALITAFVAQLGLAVLSRIVPRLSTFTLSFPVVYALALIVTLTSLPLRLPLSAAAGITLPLLTHG